MMWRLQSRGLLTALLLPVKSKVVLGAVLLLAVLFVANGIHILTRGRIGPRLTKLPQSSKVLPWASRLAAAGLYLAVGAGLALLVWRLAIA